MENELKSCPFCGKEGMFNKIRRADENGRVVLASTMPDSHYKWEYQVECSNCGCASTNWFKTKKGAFNQWNRRAT